MVCMVEQSILQSVEAAIGEHSPKPTELLDILHDKYSYTEIQEAVAELLDSGRVLLDTQRHLKVKQAA
jgi:hypothetical protein